MFFVHYLGVCDADDTFNETILLCDLEDRHTVLSILLHPIGTTIRPVLVAHLLQWRKSDCKTYRQSMMTVVWQLSDLSILHQV